MRLATLCKTIRRVMQQAEHFAIYKLACDGRVLKACNHLGILYKMGLV
ncbi:hypothetical protein [uncultured Helicobacter sp.]|nr:hypothetical protein [uncultured Helicobacter sp.]